MPGGKGRGKPRKGGAVRGRQGPQAPAAPKRPARSALGNDPFVRGAATRPALERPLTLAAPEETAPPSTPRPTPTPRPSPSPSPRPTPTSTPTSTGGGASRLGSPGGELPPGPTSKSGGSGPRLPPTSTPTASELPPSAAARLSELEKGMASSLDALETRLVEAASRAGLAGARGELREVIARLLPRAKDALVGILDLARLVEPAERLDRFGQDARFGERARPILELLYGTWWRVEARAIEKVPAEGPVVVVANHAGYVPWDALVLRHALGRDHPARRELRPLLDDREVALPLFGALAVRLGAVRASADAADRILREGGAIGVFPEGSAGARKPWRERYRIQRFGRGGFVKVAIRAGAKIVPCAIVGSEEATPGIARTGWLADRLGVPLLSSSALRVGAAALLPLPSRWTLRFGDPVDVAARGLSAEDAPAVGALADEVRATLQAMLDEGLAARGSVFL